MLRITIDSPADAGAHLFGEHADKYLNDLQDGFDVAALVSAVSNALGSPDFDSVLPNAWGAVTYLTSHGFRVLLPTILDEMQQEGADSSLCQYICLSTYDFHSNQWLTPMVGKQSPDDRAEVAQVLEEWFLRCKDSYATYFLDCEKTLSLWRM